MIYLKRLITGAAFLMIVATMGICTTHAAVTLQDFEEGTIVMTNSEGIFIVEPQDDIPELAGVLELYDGQFGLATGEGDEITVSCLDVNFDCGNGSAVNLKCGDDSGLLKVVSGFATLTDERGEILTIKEGEEYPIVVGTPLGKAPPTAMIDPLGFPIGDEEPPDSRNIDNSPST